MSLTKPVPERDLIGTQVSYSGATTLNNGTLALQDTTAFASAITLERFRAGIRCARRPDLPAATTFWVEAVSGTGTLEHQQQRTGIAGGWTSSVRQTD
ncbi:MAG: hypothetical protein U1F87_13975 [Kiritimatiellia bacterium]